MAEASIANDVDGSAIVLVVSVNSFGRTFKGVLAAMAFIEIVSSTEDKEQRSGPVLATEDALTFGYLDPVDHVISRAKDSDLVRLASARQ